MKWNVNMHEKVFIILKKLVRFQRSINGTYENRTQVDNKGIYVIILSKMTFIYKLVPKKKTEINHALF